MYALEVTEYERWTAGERIKAIAGEVAQTVRTGTQKQIEESAKRLKDASDYCVKLVAMAGSSALTGRQMAFDDQPFGDALKDEPEPDRADEEAADAHELDCDGDPEALRARRQAVLGLLEGDRDLAAGATPNGLTAAQVADQLADVDEDEAHRCLEWLLRQSQTSADGEERPYGMERVGSVYRLLPEEAPEAEAPEVTAAPVIADEPRDAEELRERFLAELADGPKTAAQLIAASGADVFGVPGPHDVLNAMESDGEAHFVPLTQDWHRGPRPTGSVKPASKDKAAQAVAQEA